ncbi:uncharacterized protein LOC100864462 isoform X1 [Apis florea]|uniref:uncharacterized protein LOC100864462 isoform X1 n=1 Tax=Apis florea TaxID=7463 RepID=UPI0012FF5974|nr:uncharacterized protein LOC100864462 isoform X1 [Apis florea]
MDLDKTLYIFCFRNDESLCSCCWSAVLAITRGWRRALFYLPLSCILAWKPYSLWLSYVAAGLLAVLSLLHITSSALGIRGSCQMSNATDSVGESLLNTRPENYDRFEEVLIECIAQGDGSTGRRCVWTNRTSGRQRRRNMTRTSALMGERIR